VRVAGGAVTSALVFTALLIWARDSARTAAENAEAIR
jgi:hypothetical protein